MTSQSTVVVVVLAEIDEVVGTIQFSGLLIVESLVLSDILVYHTNIIVQIKGIEFLSEEIRNTISTLLSIGSISTGSTSLSSVLSVQFVVKIGNYTDIFVLEESVYTLWESDFGAELVLV